MARRGKVATTGDAKQEGQRDDQPPSYGALMSSLLAATIAGDDDELMRLRAETITQFRRTDAQIEAALFKLHTQREVGGKATRNLNRSTYPASAAWIGWLRDSSLTTI